MLFPRYAIAKHAFFTDRLQAFDQDGDALTFVLVTPPVRGTLVVTDPAAGDMIYVPNDGAEGTDTFTFSVSDGTATSDISLVTIDIAPDVTPPIISAIANVTTPEDTTTNAIAFTVGDAETPADLLTLTAVSDNLALVPAANILFGGTGANRTVTIHPATHAFGAANLAVTASAQNAALIPTVTLGGSGASRTISVTPAANQSGTTTITVNVADGTASPGVATFNVTVAAPPSLAAIGNQTGFSGLAGIAIALTLSDPDSLPSALTITATSSNPTLIPPSGIVITGTGANRTLVITPANRSEGNATITLTISDSLTTSTTTFQIQVFPRPEFELVELPSTETGGYFPVDLNENGQIVGQLISGGTGLRPLLWDVNGTLTLTTLRNDSSFVAAINNAGNIVGTAGGNGYLLRNGVFTTIGSPGYFLSGINNSGLIAGDFSTSHFVFDGVTFTTVTGVFDEDRSLFLNDLGDAVGEGPNSTAAVLWQVTNPDLGIRIVRNLGNLGSDNNVSVRGINNAAQIVATVENEDDSTEYPVIFNYRTNTLTNLAAATQSITANPSAVGINDFGEVIGEDFNPGGLSFLYTDGRAFNLQQLVDGNTLRISRLGDINNDGDIIGRLERPLAGGGTRHVPVLLRRKPTDVGQPIPPPLAAVNTSTNLVFRAPAFEATDGTPPEEAAQAFFWSAVDQRAYALRPIIGRITWFTSADPLAVDAKMTRRLKAEWPANPQIHVAGAPAKVEPLDAASPYRAIAKAYSTVGTSAYDASSKVLQVPQPGYTVIRYLLAPGTPLGAFPDASTHRNYFQVVRTVEWNDPDFLVDGQAARVGEKVSDPRGIANSPKSGWTVFERGPYDGVGADRAYDRATQTGPIIPVNVDTTANDDDLVVAHYKFNARTGALWPDLPVRYSITWPPAPTLVIANPEGSGSLSPTQFPEKQIYNQPVPALSGYNPNEEHALFAPGTSGEALFALRNDLNRDATSLPYVLLKYRDPATNEWRMRVYGVQLTDATHRFFTFADAGQELSVPYPLSLLPLCRDLTRLGGFGQL